MRKERAESLFRILGILTQGSGYPTYNKKGRRQQDDGVQRQPNTNIEEHKQIKNNGDRIGQKSTQGIQNREFNFMRVIHTTRNHITSTLRGKVAKRQMQNLIIKLIAQGVQQVAPHGSHYPLRQIRKKILKKIQENSRQNQANDRLTNNLQINDETEQ